MAVAALMGMIVMLFVMNMLMLVHLSIMLMRVGVFIICMTAHYLSPPVLFHNMNSTRRL